MAKTDAACISSANQMAGRMSSSDTCRACASVSRWLERSCEIDATIAFCKVSTLEQTSATPSTTKNASSSAG